MYDYKQILSLVYILAIYLTLNFFASDDVQKPTKSIV